MTPEQARTVLLHRRDFVATWISMELLGGTSRARRRYQEQQDREQVAARAENRRLEELAALPDADLAWLLANDWDPARA